jgi:predicted short-subunit dehydrogenase-like oxidoreductase (DUF2520 family)
MQIALVGPGSAGQALALAARAAGHEVVAVAARDPGRAQRVARTFGAVALGIGDPLPPVDLVAIAVVDDAIVDVADAVAPVARNAAAAAVHLSGATPLSALAAIEREGIPIGAFHPLQTLPDPTRGARALPGSWIAVTASEPLRSALHGLAASMGCRPFDLADEHRVVYHAAASAMANFPIAALAIAERLAEQAELPFEAARPLVESVVVNVFADGPGQSLTGPIARGDTATVAAQVAAVHASVPGLAEAFEAMVQATTIVASMAQNGGGG